MGCVSYAICAIKNRSNNSKYQTRTSCIPKDGVWAAWVMQYVRSKIARTAANTKHVPHAYPKMEYGLRELCNMRDQKSLEQQQIPNTYVMHTQRWSIGCVSYAIRAIKNRSNSSKYQTRTSCIPKDGVWAAWVMQYARSKIARTTANTKHVRHAYPKMEYRLRELCNTCDQKSLEQQQIPNTYLMHTQRWSMGCVSYAICAIKNRSNNSKYQTRTSCIPKDGVSAAWVMQYVRSKIARTAANTKHVPHAYPKMEYGLRELCNMRDQKSLEQQQIPNTYVMHTQRWSIGCVSYAIRAIKNRSNSSKYQTRTSCIPKDGVWAAWVMQYVRSKIARTAANTKHVRHVYPKMEYGLPELCNTCDQKSLEQQQIPNTYVMHAQRWNRVRELCNMCDQKSLEQQQIPNTYVMYTQRWSIGCVSYAICAIKTFISKRTFSFKEK